MKKLIILVFIIAFPFLASAQTEEETKSWLKEKLTKYIVGRSGCAKIEISINSCEITIDYLASLTNATFQTKFPTEGITFTNEGISSIGEVITDQNITDGTSRKFMNLTKDFILKDGEPELRKRTKKALDHLSTFCAKKKEAF